MSENKLAQCIVIKVIDDYRVVINKGSKDGVVDKTRFLIYKLDEELFDPETKESLGKLEIVKGTGSPVHIQERMATIESDKFVRSKDKRTVIKKRGGGTLIGLTMPSTEEVIEPGDRVQEPFENPEVGDIAKLIS